MLPIEVCVPTAISGSVDISKALEVIYYDRLVLKELLQRLVSHKTHSLPFCFEPIFNLINYGHIIKKM